MEEISEVEDQGERIAHHCVTRDEAALDLHGPITMAEHVGLKTEMEMRFTHQMVEVVAI